MPDPTPKSQRPRPIRELIWPEIERPMDSPADGEERRRYQRYERRRIPGTLIADGVQHLVSCADISYGGMRVVSGAPLPLQQGERVLVQIHQLGRTFEDEFTVRGSEPSPDGTVIHLAM